MLCKEQEVMKEGILGSVIMDQTLHNTSEEAVREANPTSVEWTQVGFKADAENHSPLFKLKKLQLRTKPINKDTMQTLTTNKTSEYHHIS